MAEEIIGSAKVRISFDDLKNLDRQIDTTGHKFVEQVGAMESKTAMLSRTIGGLTGVIATIGIAKLGSDIIGAATKMDSMNKQLLSVEKSQDKVNQRLAQFKQIAKDPGLGLKQMSDGYVRLVNASLASEKSINLMRKLGNAVALVGGSAENLDRVSVQFMQIAGKANVMAQDINAIAESMPQIRQLMREAYGTSDTEALQKMNISTKQFIDDMIKGLGGLERAQTGAKNAQDNFNDALFQFKPILGSSVLPAVTDFLEKTTDLMERFNAMPDATKNIIGKATMGVVAGTGLLGIAGVLITIGDKAKVAVDGLKALSAVNAASSVGNATPALAGLFGGGTTKAGATALGMTIPQLAVTTLVVTGAAYLGAGLLGKMAGGVPATYIPSGEYVAASGKGLSAYQPLQQKAFKDLQNLQMEAGNFPNKTLAEINPVGSQAVEGILEAFNLDYSIWRDKTFAEVEKQLGLTAKGRQMYATPAGPPEAPKGVDWSKFPRAEAFTPDEQGGIYAGMAFNQRPTQATMPVSVAKALDEIIQTGLPPTNFYETKTPDRFGSYALHSASVGSLKPAGLGPQMGIGGRKPGEGLSPLLGANLGIGQLDPRENLDAIMDIETSMASIKNDWEDIGGFIQQADKKQSMFWKNLEQMGLYSMDKVVSKGINQMFDHLFQSQETAIEAWNDYGHKTGYTWEQFETQWESQNENMTQSWKDFTKEMARDWAIMLAQMEAEAIAKDIYGKITGSDTGGTSILGKGIDWATNNGNNNTQNNNTQNNSGGSSDVSNLGSAGILSKFGELGIVAGVGIGSYTIGKKIKGSSFAKKHPTLAKFASAAFGLGGAFGGEALPSFDSGGISYKPQMYYAGIPEAHIPLQGGKVPVNINGGGGGNYTINISFPNADANNIDPVVFKNKIKQGIDMLVSEGKLNKAVNG